MRTPVGAVTRRPKALVRGIPTVYPQNNIVVILSGAIAGAIPLAGRQVSKANDVVGSPTNGLHPDVRDAYLAASARRFLRIGGITLVGCALILN